MTKESQRSRKPRFRMLRFGLRSMLRGDISVNTAAREYLRRLQTAKTLERERRTVDDLAREPAQLVPEYQTRSPSELLEHFRSTNRPKFFAGFEHSSATASLLQTSFRPQVDEIIESAKRITEHRWPLLGFGENDFGRGINWNRDPLSGRVWPAEFHADIVLWHNDGSDIRVLWELNRLGHFLTLGQAYALTRNEAFAEEFFGQLESWREQNPLGRGANWCCAMEVALRAMNIIGAFVLFRDSPGLTPERLMNLLAMLDQHGGHIERNLEFSHVSTSNHYLSDLTGLLWLGIMLPELSSAEHWKQWALHELLREMDKQILPDGADYEASTGYHRLVLELFLYSFILCQNNDVPIEDRYWQKLHLMFKYLLGILRPDGFAPLIGDTDGGQVLPIMQHRADDHAYLLSLGASLFNDGALKTPDCELSAEACWLLGAAGVDAYESLVRAEEPAGSQAFPAAGTYVQKEGNLFLLFNTAGAGVNGRGSHGHNDGLSIEVSACGRAFIVDPATYVYTADLAERHVFRSTAYHSTIQVDEREQNTIQLSTPFVVGNESKPRLTRWETSHDRDYAVGEHDGYSGHGDKITHERRVTFNKRERWWLLEDVIHGTGMHQIAARFHFDSGLVVTAERPDLAAAYDEVSGARLFVHSIDAVQSCELIPQFSSKHYGAREPSTAAMWTLTADLPCTLRWAIVPVCSDENAETRLNLIASAELSQSVSKPIP